MDVSIIIVNYKTVNLISDCIKSIKKNTTGISYEIIVVDNNSGDNCKSVFSQVFGSENGIVCVDLDENVGFGQGNNAGFKIAKGRNVICLNPDTILLNNALKILSDYLDQHPEVGVCGGNLYDEDLKPTLSYATFFPSISHELDELSHGMLSRSQNGESTKFNHTGRVLPVAYITGADLMTRKAIIEETGGFSPAFFMYYEETDLTKRIKEIGYSVHSVPEAKIQHLEGRSFQPATVNERKIKLSEQGRRTYYRRHYPAYYRLVANTVYGVFLLSRYLLFKMKGSKRASAFRCRLKYFHIM